ncbi:MAG: hypothetical protein ACOC92_02080 [bacterium]
MAALNADPTFQDVFGDAGYLAGERPHEVPSWDWMMLVDLEEEVEGSQDFQFDLYAETAQSVRDAERALRRLLVRDRPYTLGGEWLRGEYIAGREFRGPESDQYFRRSLDIRLTTLRDRYH